MPLQPRVPLGALGGTVDSHDERMRCRETNRFGRLGQYWAGTVTAKGTGWTYPGYEVTATVGASGNVCVFCWVETITINPAGDTNPLIGLALDGGSPVVINTAVNYNGVACIYAFATTPGQHTFTVAFSDGPLEPTYSTTFTNTSLVVWPL